MVDIDGVAIRMSNVLYVPQLDANLLSISALNKKGLNVLFHQNGVDILRKGTSVATGFLNGRTYFLRSSQVALKAYAEVPDTKTSDNNNKVGVVSAPIDKQITPTKEAEYRLWHARMGHPSPKRL